MDVIQMLFLFILSENELQECQNIEKNIQYTSSSKGLGPTTALRKALWTWADAQIDYAPKHNVY